LRVERYLPRKKEKFSRRDGLGIRADGRGRNGEPAVITDADTRSLDRDEWQKKYRAAFDRKRRIGDMRSRDPIRVEFERIL
jgi:hypothetical protein